jgi:uroporphyrinogen-III synthase
MICIGSGSGNAENLAKIIVEQKSSNEELFLLFPCGNLTDIFLSTELAPKNVRIEQIVCYETKPRSRVELFSHLNSFLSEDDSFDFVVFFSPSGVQSSKDYFFEQISYDHSRTKFVALGLKTSAEMEKSGLRVSAVCERPNAVSLIEAIKNCENI